MPRFFVSTDQVPERDRVAFYREELAFLTNMDVVPLTEGPPSASLDHLGAGPVEWTTAIASPTRYVRTRRHTADSDDSFQFGILEEGAAGGTIGGREVSVRSGDAYLLQHARPFDTAFPVGGRLIPLRIRAAALKALVRNPEAAAGTRYDGALPGLLLLRGYLAAFSPLKDSLAPDLLNAFGQHVVDLVASLIGTTRDGAVMAEEGCIKAARLRAVLATIAARAAEPGFGVKDLGAELTVTPRYIQLLLEETGTTFSAAVLEHRMQRAWRLLSNPVQRLKIATVAHDCGYNDIGTFNRTFRRRFGETPTAVRGAAVAPAPASGPARKPTLAEHLASPSRRSPPA